MEGRIWEIGKFWVWNGRMIGWWMIRVVMMTLGMWDDRGEEMNQEEADHKYGITMPQSGGDFSILLGDYLYLFCCPHVILLCAPITLRFLLANISLLFWPNNLVYKLPNLDRLKNGTSTMFFSRTNWFISLADEQQITENYKLHYFVMQCYVQPVPEVAHKLKRTKVF